MFDRIYKYAKLISLLCIVPLTVYVCIFLWQLKQTAATVTTVASALPAQVDDRIGKLQKGVLDKIDTVQDKLQTQITSLATLTDNRIGSITSVADKRLGSLEKDTFSTVNDVRKDVNNQLTTTNGSVSTLVAAYAKIPADVNARYDRDFDKYFNCTKNALCLQGQTSDTLFAVRTTSRDISTTMMGVNDTLPKIEKDITSVTGNISLLTTTLNNDVPKITGNIASITDNIKRISTPHWYDRVLGYGLNGIMMYRSLNPVTNFTLSGFQAIASKP